MPPLITHVETLPAPTDDGAAIAPTHADLEAKGLLPQAHIVDAGYADSKLLVTSADRYGVDMLGPTRRDPRWQAQAGQGFAAADFTIDWDHETATCPMGKTSTEWRPRIDGRHNHVIKIRFGRAACGSCPVRSSCTTSTSQRRTITVRPRAQYEALQRARAREATGDYARQYQRRAGIEGTLSYGVRAMALRRSRYIGLARTHLQHVLTATAINVMRIGRWLTEEPAARTRRSTFAGLHRGAT